jgi:hypothetical protein
MIRVTTLFSSSTNPMLPAVAVALSAVAWFLAVTWLNVVGGARLHLPAAIVSGMLVMLFTLFPLVAPRSRLHRGSRPCSMSHRFG